MYLNPNICIHQFFKCIKLSFSTTIEIIGREHITILLDLNNEIDGGGLVSHAALAQVLRHCTNINFQDDNLPYTGFQVLVPVLNSLFLCNPLNNSFYIATTQNRFKRVWILDPALGGGNDKIVIQCHTPEYITNEVQFNIFV